MAPYRIPELTEPYTQYDMIKSHTELPPLPELRAKLLFLFLNHSHLQNDSEVYTLATALVQLGLDTHNLVSITNMQKEKIFARGRQLKVLAGDYFSSRFYHILAQAGQVNVIKQLAEAICEVNRMKMNLYLLMKQLKITAADYLEAAINIRIELFLSFQNRVAEFLQPWWPEMLRGLSKCELLVEEIKLHEKPEEIRGSWAFWHMLQSGTKEEKKRLSAADADELGQLTQKCDTISLLHAMLEDQILRTASIIKQLGPEKLRSELEPLIEPFRVFVQSRMAYKELTR